MLKPEDLKKIRSIEISTRLLLDDLMSGSYRSSFKGQGVQFSEHRIYVPGDDIRHIDWKVSARTREPLVKKYEEERELSVLLVVDASASLDFGSDSRTKGELASEVAGMLAYSAAMAGDKVGLLLFSDEVEKLIPLRKGKAHVSRILKEMIEFRPKRARTRLSAALDIAGRLMKHKGIVILVSDFIDEGYDLSLRRLARRHDVVAIQVEDRLESTLPRAGFLVLEGLEGEGSGVVDTQSWAFQRWLEQFHQSHDTDTRTALKSGRVDPLKIRTASDPAELLAKYFYARSQRRR